MEDVIATKPDDMDFSLKAGIIAVGDAGVQTLSRIKQYVHQDFSLLALNTEWKSLGEFNDEERFLLGRKIFRGIGSGGNGERVDEAINDDWNALKSIVKDWKVAIIVVGLGGSTGSVVAPFIARQLKAEGCVAIVFGITPFSFEGMYRRELCNSVLGVLRSYVQVLVEFSNDLIIQVQDDELPIQDSYCNVDNWVLQGISAWGRVLFEKGLVNLDFSKIHSLLSISLGKTFFALGSGKGPDCVKNAMKELADCPLIQHYGNIEHYDRILVSILAGRRLGLGTLHSIAEELRRYFPEGDYIWNATQSDSEEDLLEMCVFAVTDISLQHDSLLSGQVKTDNTLGKGKREQANAEAFPVSELLVKKKKLIPVSRIGEQQDLFAAEKSLYRGVDLDAPTFIRKGVKIL